MAAPATKLESAPDPLPTVVQALSAVMGAVQSVGKTGRNTQQNYNFRGVDAVVNAVGPALRSHGVVVVPVAVTLQTERYTTKSGTAMKGVEATITFRFYGPAGDWIEAQAVGESSDSGDKSVPKAHSVAYRTMLLQALCIPTDDPDPDTESHERAHDAHGLQSARADAVSRHDRMRERIAVLASEADAKRDVAAGTSAAEIATKLGEAPDEQKLSDVGVDVADWIAEGCAVSFADYVPVKF